MEQQVRAPTVEPMGQNTITNFIISNNLTLSLFMCLSY